MQAPEDLKIFVEGIWCDTHVCWLFRKLVVNFLAKNEVTSWACQGPLASPETVDLDVVVDDDVEQVVTFLPFSINFGTVRKHESYTTMHQACSQSHFLYNYEREGPLCLWYFHTIRTQIWKSPLRWRFYYGLPQLETSHSSSFNCWWSLCFCQQKKQ